MALASAELLCAYDQADGMENILLPQNIFGQLRSFLSITLVGNSHNSPIATVINTDIRCCVAVTKDFNVCSPFVVQHR